MRATCRQWRDVFHYQEVYWFDTPQFLYEFFHHIRTPVQRQGTIWLQERNKQWLHTVFNLNWEGVPWWGFHRSHRMIMW